jgi:hypothetical protein
VLSNRLQRNHLARFIKDPRWHGGWVAPIYEGELMHPLPAARNSSEVCWLRQTTARTTGKDSSVADWVTTRSDLS